jgi:hypothetical protein
VNCRVSTQRCPRCRQDRDTGECFPSQVGSGRVRGSGWAEWSAGCGPDEASHQGPVAVRPHGLELGPEAVAGVPEDVEVNTSR